MRRLALLMAAIGAVAHVAPASAQNCTSPPSAGGALTPVTIATAGSDAIKALIREEQLSGSARQQQRAARVQLFRKAANMNWRYVCDYRLSLPGKPKEHARALTRGVIFFDLSDDLTRAREWLRPARDRVGALPAGQMAMFAERRLDHLIGVASDRLAVKAKRNNGLAYFSID